MGDEYEITVQVQLPVDADGFLRRECPHCMRMFKWHDGPANETAEGVGQPSSYSCPLCGQASSEGSWYTPEQLDYLEQAVTPSAFEAVGDVLEAAFKGMRGVKYERGDEIAADAPAPLVELDDMTIMASPCHDYELIKVPEDHVGTLYCLVCGSAFAV